MPVYCITGTNRGLGLEFVRQLAQSPDNTIIAATRSLSSDLSDLKAVASPSTHILECDTSNVASIHAFVKEVKQTLGDEKKIDFLLNSAGVNVASSQSSLSLGPDELQQNIAVNVIGPAKMVELLLDAGLLSKDVRILNMTSGLGSLQRSSEIKPRKCAPYSISKAGLNMLTVHQSEDLKPHLPGSVVICMDPGWVKTRMGGDGAVLEASQSIGDMLKVLHGLKAEDTGSFYHHTGEKIPW
ncbi:NAD(P)-binding protein [Parathielavia appendiculata]|uniref:NAD(P)-binding protein n=1 Tax=Parathielavia appendiculata TaxID=2587402 RepID=A0AAN6YYZ3_9PEZI|nr:NAD(P)-binding protein [Parathielavia appendiculata]